MHLEISRKNSKRNLHRSILQFSHSFERISRKNMAIKELEIQKYPPLSISSIQKNAFGNFAQKFEKKSPSKYPPFFGFALFFRTHFEKKKYGDRGIGNLARVRHGLIYIRATAGQPQYYDVTTGPSIACTHSSKLRSELEAEFGRWRSISGERGRVLHIGEEKSIGRVKGFL